MKRLLIGLIVAVCSVQVVAEPYRIAVLPDTQWAVQKWPHLVDRMTAWIDENRQALDIKCVLHVGDMVQDGWKPEEWKRFDQSMRRLDGKVPYVLAVGNHDFDKLKGKRSAVLFNRFFPRSRLAAQTGFGDSFPQGTSDNTYLTFAAGDAKWLVVSLKFHPDDAELAWANGVVARHGGHHVIILTHHYLTHKGRDVPGERIWEQLVRRHGNIRFVICGHLSTVHYVDTADKGNKVYQMLFDWQNDRQPDNNSYLALIELDPDKKSISVRTYSPQLDKFKTDRRARFEFADAGFLAAPVSRPAVAARVAAEDAPLRALFLGDRGHHKPSERYGQLRPVLSRRGIQLTYTQDLADINSANLGRYDALIVYANIARIEPSQEKAILDYVAGGGGFVPLHCASYCFHNSPDLIALTGAQFKSHGGGVFRTRITGTDHPVMKGFTGFESWDETYVHHRHNEKNRTVLSYRDQEPWTWVRTHGKGRVFYTAWGHDHRTWGNPGFQELVERGIRWAAGRPVVVASAAKKNRVALRYEPRPTVQNYEKRKPYPQYQLPLSPKDSMDYIEVEPGFDLQLFAAEPDIVKPMAFTWDHRGRLWLLESVDYPNTLTDQEKGNDRIKICEDTDGDGHADKFTIFAEGLNIPTGLTFANGGLIVSQAPHFLYFADTDGDDRADVRKIIMTGWGKGDTHAGPSNLRYGLDNWIYGSVGYSNFRGKVGEKSYSFGRGIYRFDRGLTEIDFITQYSNNTWGLGISETGELFGSTANNTHHMYTGIPNRYFAGLEGISAGRRGSGGGAKIDAHYAAHPLTPRIRQVDVFGGYTAAAGHNIYTARAFPRKYWNRAALVCEPTMHLLHQGFLKREGSGWTEDGDGWNLMAAEDEWVAPVHAEVGPDGAVWVADWYNFIIQHNPTPNRGRGGFDATNGPGNAHVNPLRDKKHGRIYRIAWKSAKPPGLTRLDPADGQQLVAALRSDNMFWRTTAQRLLVQRGKRDVVPALLELASDSKVDEIGLNGGVVHALWTLHGLGAMDGSNPEAIAVATKALQHPSVGVRKNAAYVLPRNSPSALALASSGLLTDADTNVRLRAFLAASEMPANDSIGVLLFSQAGRPEVTRDRFLPRALAIAAAAHSRGYLKAVLASRARRAIDKSEADQPDGKNLMPNPSFEDLQGNKPVAWKVRNYGGSAEHQLVEGGRTGKRCLQISSTEGSDTSWYTTVKLQPNNRYRLSGWVKTENVRGAMGGLFNAHEIQGRENARTKAIKSTSDWSRVEVTFNSGNRTEVTINCLFGGWGRSTGTAWFDDVSLVRLGLVPGVDPTDTTAIVARAFGRRADYADQLAMLERLPWADDRTAAVILDGIAVGWSGRDRPKPAGADTARFQKIADALAPGNRGRLKSIVEAWEVKGVTIDVAASVSPAVTPRAVDDTDRRTVTINTVREKMQYDVKRFKVKAGEKIKLVLNNPDQMLHNLLIIRPGTLERVGAAADAMLTDPRAQERSFIPESRDILFATELVGPDQSITLRFRAPDQPGEYPYVCTFPGHWRIMRGVMVVEAAN